MRHLPPPDPHVLAVVLQVRQQPDALAVEDDEQHVRVAGQQPVAGQGGRNWDAESFAR